MGPQVTEKLKWQPSEWENIFTDYTSDRGLLPTIHKGHKNHPKYQENITQLKMWHSAIYRVIKRWNKNGREASQKMFNIFNQFGRYKLKLL